MILGSEWYAVVEHARICVLKWNAYRKLVQCDTHPHLCTIICFTTNWIQQDGFIKNARMLAPLSENLLYSRPLLCLWWECHYQKDKREFIGKEIKYCGTMHIGTEFQKALNWQKARGRAGDNNSPILRSNALWKCKAISLNSVEIKIVRTEAEKLHWGIFLLGFQMMEKRQEVYWSTQFVRTSMVWVWIMYYSSPLLSIYIAWYTLQHSVLNGK